MSARPTIWSRLRAFVRFVLVVAYWAVTRLAVGAVLLVTCLHFVLNSGPFPEALSGALRSVLPGTIRFSALQISPVPWKVDVLDVHISTPNGEDIITAGTVHATMDLIPLVRWVVGESGDLLEIGFRSARLEDFSCVIAFDDKGDLKFLNAFEWPPEPEDGQPSSGGSGPKVRLRFASILGERGTFLLSFPEWDLRVNGISLETSLTVREDGGGVDIRTRDLTFSGGAGNIRAAPGAGSIPRVVALDAGRVRGFHFDRDHFRIDRAEIALGGLDVDASGMLAFPVDGPLAYDANADIRFHAVSPPVKQATRGVVEGPFRLTVEGKGDESDPRFHGKLTSDRLVVAGLPLGKVDLVFEGGKDAKGAYAFSAPALSAHPGGGHIDVKNAFFHPFGKKNDGYPDAGLSVKMKGIDLESVLGSLGAPAMPSLVPSVRGLGGRLRASIAFGSPEDPDTVIDLNSKMRGSLAPGSLLDGKDLTVEARANLRISMDDTVVRVRSLAAKSGRDEIAARGRIDLSLMKFDARGSLTKEIGSLARAFGSSGKGKVTLSRISAGGRVLRPTLNAEMEGSELAFGKWEIGGFGARVSLAGDRLTLAGAGFKTPYGTFELGSARIWPVSGPARSRQVEVSDLSVSRFNLMRFPPLQGMGLKGSGKVLISKAGVQLGRPAETLYGKGSVSFGLMGVMGKRFSRVKANFVAVKGRIEVPQASARLLKGEIGASGFVDLGRRVFGLELSGDGLPLAAIAGTGKSGPLQGAVGLRAKASGSLDDPSITASVDAEDLSWDGIDLGGISLSADRGPGKDLKISSDRFLPRISLNPATSLTWKNGTFDGIHLVLDFDRLTPQDINPAIRERDFWARFTGNLDLKLGFGSDGTLWAALTSPPDGLELGFMDREVSVVNRESLNVTIHETQNMTVSGLALDDGSGILEVCGEALDPDGGSHLLARGPVGMYWLRFLKDVFSVADGYMLLAAAPGQSRRDLPPGCQPTMMDGVGSTRIGGNIWPVFQPSLAGLVTTGPMNLSIRRYPQRIHVDAGSRIVLSPAPGDRVRAVIDGDARLKGMLGDGRFTIDGEAMFKGYTPDEGRVAISGTGIRYSSAGNYFVVGNPDIVATFTGLNEPDLASMVISGNLAVTDGSYHRSFDMLEKALSGVTGSKVAEREGPPLASVAPWLAAARLDLTVTGSRFGVRTRLPFGTSDLDMVMDLALKGTFNHPEVWNRMEVKQGGKFIYSVVRREFEVLRGYFDFDGDPERPQVDVTARTTVEYRDASITDAGVSSRFAPDMATGGMSDDDVVILLNISGRYPDLDISLSSNTRDLDENDLMYLALTGQTSLDSSEGESSGFIDIGILTDDLTNVVTNLLLSPFLDAVRLGVSSTGGVNAQVQAHMGSRIKFETQIMQEEGGSRYRAGFQVKLSDRFFLEGRLKAVEQSIDPSEVGRRYETKLRYRIPID